MIFGPIKMTGIKTFALVEAVCPMVDTSCFLTVSYQWIPSKGVVTAKRCEDADNAGKMK
jgi:hypothetical protein